MEPQTATIKSVTQTGGVYFVRVEVDAGGEIDDVMLYTPAGLAYHPKIGDSCIIEYPYGIANNPIARSVCVATPTTVEGDCVLFDDHDNELKLSSDGSSLNSTALKPFTVGGTGASGLAIASSFLNELNKLTDEEMINEPALLKLVQNLKISLAPTGIGVTQTFKTK